MNDSREFQEVDPVCSGRLSHVPSKPAVILSPRGLPSCDQSLRPEERNPHGISGDVFGTPFASANTVSTSCGRVPHPWEKSATYGDLVQPSSSEPVVSLLYGRHPVSRYDDSVFAETSTEKPVAKSEVQKRHTTPIPRFAKRPSAGNSNSPSEGLYSQNHMIDPRLQVSELHFDKFPTSSTFSCWKIRFKTQVSACSGSPTEAMLWIKEVEMVDSMEDLKSSQSVARHTHWPNFELLDARIASSLNKIIQNSHFKKKVSLEEQKTQKEDRFLRGGQIANMIYDYFQVTGTHDTVLDYA